MSRTRLPPEYSAYQYRIDDAGPVASFRQMALVIVAVVLCFAFVPDLVADTILGDDALADFRDGTSAIGLFLQLSSFGIPLWLLVYLIRRIHGRDIWSVVGPYGRLRSGFLATLVAVTAVLGANEVLPPWYTIDGMTLSKPVIVWAMTLAPGLVAIGIQVSAEEVFFRGYIQQQLAAFSPKRWVWLVLPSVAFGLIHLANDAGAVDGALWVIFATLLGMACADLTARHGTLGPAIALHLANNVFAFFVLGMDGAPQSGFALWLIPFQDMSIFDLGLDQLLQPWALTEILIMSLFVGCLWLAGRIAIRR